MTPQQQRSKEAFNHEVRIEGILDLAVESAMTSGYVSAPDHLEEFLSDLMTTRLDETLKPVAQFLMSQGDDEEEVLGMLSDLPYRPDLLGICLQVATPVRRECGTYSWGYYTTTWVWGPTYEEAWRRGVEWAKERAVCST